jgi:hypothetical protein
MRDLRRYAAQTNLRLIGGLFALLVVVGLGLVYLFWGVGAFLTGLLCLGATLLPVLAVVAVLWLLETIKNKANHD